MERKIGFGIIGCGVIADFHANALFEIPEEAVLVGVADARPESAQRFALAKQVRAFASVEEMLACPEIDVVTICVPSGFHADIAVKAAIAGKHIIVEKPMAITKEQLDAVCDGSYIQWLGYRTDVRDLLKQCHIMAFPSYYMEGLPKSLIEADAIGRPIITSNSVGCKETLVDGYNGFLIQPKDVDALTEKLDLLLSDKELRMKMGKNARKYAEDYFSIEVVKERHLAIYDELVRNI